MLSIPGAATILCLLLFTFHIIGYPVINGDTINFSMSYQGRDRLFSIINNKVFLFNPEYPNHTTGDYHLSANNGKYTWMMFTAVGFHAVNGTGRYEEVRLPGQTIDNKLIAATAPTNHAVANYKKSFKLFNFHSWRPYISDPDILTPYREKMYSILSYQNYILLITGTKI